MKAKEYLSQIKKLDTQIKNKTFEKNQIEALGENTGAIKEEIEGLRRKKRKVIADMEKLNEAEYDVLHKHYVQGKTLKEIAALRDSSYSLITTIHGAALQKIEKIINGANSKARK